ncbi:hypothetical protein UlMin_030287 [Ulmus minor]
MGPSGRRRRSRRKTKTRRTLSKKKLQTTNISSNSSSSSSISSNVIDCSSKITEEVEAIEDEVVSTSSGCSTPKGKKFRIPEIETCPPAPKKQRVISNCTNIQRTPIAFFAPPDLELFFYFALGGISV